MKIKELFTDSSRWTKGALARDINGEFTDIDHGYSFCLSRAIYKCYPYDSKLIIFKIKPKLKEPLIVNWNDAPERTFEEVKALVEELDI